MKLLCKCGNSEELKTDSLITNFKSENCGDGTTLLMCKKCNEVVFIKANDNN